MDIDIDFPTSFDPTTLDPIVRRASQWQQRSLKPHPCGIYLQNIPIDPVTQLAAIPYKDAASLGFFKVDCLHLSVLDNISSKEQVRTLANTEPDWTLFENPDVVSQLFQIHKHADVITALKPRSVMELADCIALIRPGAAYLIDKYTAGSASERAAMRPQIYAKRATGYGYKKPHAVSYALTVILQLNHMCATGAINISRSPEIE